MDFLILDHGINRIETEYEGKDHCYTKGSPDLLLTYTRKTMRYNHITVRYPDVKFKEHTQSFSGYIAQIIRHEADHPEGILI